MHALSNYLLACGIGAWFGALMSCTCQSIFFLVLHLEVGPPKSEEQPSSPM